MSKSYHVAIVGATGAVGLEMMRVLERRAFPVASIRGFASDRSANNKINVFGESITVERLTGESFIGVDLALFSAGASIARQFAPAARDSGAIVIDNSSAFRMEPEVPLVIPEINGTDVKSHRGIIANPNCTTAVTLMALYPLHRLFQVQRIFAASYQAVSGSGQRGIAELERQFREISAGQEVRAEAYPHQIAFNVLPHVDCFLENGYTREEMKLQKEASRIMHHPTFRASATCVRVPVYRAHSVAVNAEFSRPVSLERAREALAKAPGLELVDQPELNRYPMPVEVAGKDNCQVGRLRLDSAFENGLSFWVSGDQLLKGAALNAVQIAELL